MAESEAESKVITRTGCSLKDDCYDRIRSRAVKEEHHANLGMVMKMVSMWFCDGRRDGDDEDGDEDG